MRSNGIIHKTHVIQNKPEQLTKKAFNSNVCAAMKMAIFENDAALTPQLPLDIIIHLKSSIFSGPGKFLPHTYMLIHHFMRKIRCVCFFSLSCHFTYMFFLLAIRKSNFRIAFEWAGTRIRDDIQNIHMYIAKPYC